MSPDGQYRYRLTRRWAPGLPILWVMLNPSVADDQQDDPTLRRVQAFSRQWEYGALTVANLFALRATHPDELATHEDPIGPEGDRTLREAFVTHHGLVIAAWGNGGRFRDRDLHVRMIAAQQGRTFQALGVTATGAPKHPLARGRHHVPLTSDRVILES